MGKSAERELLHKSHVNGLLIAAHIGADIALAHTLKQRVGLTPCPPSPKGYGASLLRGPPWLHWSEGGDSFLKSELSDLDSPTRCGNL